MQENAAAGRLFGLACTVQSTKHNSCARVTLFWRLSNVFYAGYLLCSKSVWGMVWAAPEWSLNQMNHLPCMADCKFMELEHVHNSVLVITMDVNNMHTVYGVQ